MVNCDASVLDKPLHWKKARTVGVGLMGDLFHRAVPDSFLDQVFARIALCSRHTFIVLTKRAARMKRYLGAVQIRRTVTLPLPNLWAMVSVEDQRRCDERVPHLISTPAAVRGVSLEPMLEGPTLTDASKLDWLIIGAESLGGRAGRATGLPIGDVFGEIAIGRVIAQARTVGLPVFVKQVQTPRGRISKKPKEWPEDLRIRQMPDTALAGENDDGEEKNTADNAEP